MMNLRKKFHLQLQCKISLALLTMKDQLCTNIFTMTCRLPTELVELVPGTLGIFSHFTQVYFVLEKAVSK